MIIVRVPFRISFFGGGTDFPEFYKEYGGCVLSTTIDKYCYISLRHLPPFFEYKNQFTYSKIERFNNPAELQHPLVRAALTLIPTERLQLAYDADLPAGSGIGSSSSFAVGLLQGLHALRGELPDRNTLAKEAIYLERTYLQEAGGVQDQYEAAFGGFNKIDFTDSGAVFHPVFLPDDKKTLLEENLFLLFTGFTRFSGEISAEQTHDIAENTSTLLKMKALTDTALQLLECGKFDDFGSLLDLSWNMKRTLSRRISNPQIDHLYQTAKAAGAIGGKIIGAGGGGFMLLYVPKENQPRFLQQMKTHYFVPFHFSPSGTEILHNDTQTIESSKMVD